MQTIKEYADAHVDVEVNEKELKDKFLLAKEFNEDMFGDRSGLCLNCSEPDRNITRLKAGSWTRAKYCSNCNSIIFIYEQDRMSGAFKDHIMVYKDHHHKPNLNLVSPELVVGMEKYQNERTLPIFPPIK